MDCLGRQNCTWFARLDGEPYRVRCVRWRWIRQWSGRYFIWNWNQTHTHTHNIYWRPIELTIATITQFQLKFITTDDGVRDFKRLDPIVCTKVKRFRFSPSLVGHIDFSTPCNSELLTAPKQSKKRGKTIVGEIQRPAAIQQPGLDGNDKTKVNQVLAIIAKVSHLWYIFHFRLVWMFVTSNERHAWIEFERVKSGALSDRFTEKMANKPFHIISSSLIRHPSCTHSTIAFSYRFCFVTVS